MTDVDNLRGRWACRFCGHDQDTHNDIQGCESCTCLASPSEAAPRTDAELDAPILPAGQRLPRYEVAPSRPIIRNEDLTGPEQAAMDAWLRGSADTTGMLYAVRAALAAAGHPVAGKDSCRD